MKMIVFVQSKAGMRWDEILAAPLLRVNSIHKELIEIWQQEIAGQLGKSASALFGGASQPEQKQENYVHPILGSTPKFNSRDDYFNFVNGHGG